MPRPSLPRPSGLPQAQEATIWFRLLLPAGSIGPGKIALMRLVAETGSVSAAARALGMSHARSVKLVAELNALGTPLIATKAGGEAGGGAALTDDAHVILEDFAQLEADVRDAAAPHMRRMQQRLGGR